MITIFRSYPVIISFGFLCSFFTGAGQTFFISLFNESFKASLQLSNAELSFFYSSATLASGFLLPVVGRYFDKLGPKPLLVLDAIGLAIGCFLLGSANTVLFLAAGFFLVRLWGQGTLSLISRTTLMKHFLQSRGRALAIASLGYPLSEAILPTIAAISIVALGWQKTWLITGFAVLFLFLSVALVLLYFIEEAEVEDVTRKSVTPIVDASLSQVFRDIRFYLLIPITVFNPFILTAFFFHQMVFAQARGWSLEFVAYGFVAYGTMRALGSFLIGGLIDRFTAAKLILFHMIPIIIGYTLFALIHDGWVLFVYLGLAGLTVGTGSNIKSVIFAEYYGVKVLGTINGFLTSCMVFSTAISPLVLGWMLDSGWRHSTVIFTFIAAGVGTMLLCLVALRLRRQ